MVSFLLPRDIVLFVHMIFYFYSSTDCFLRCLTFPCLLRQFHVKLIFKRLVIGEALVSMGFKMKKVLGLMTFLTPLLTCILYRTNRHEYVTQKASCIYAYLEFRFPLAVIKKFIYPPEKKNVNSSFCIWCSLTNMKSCGLRCELRARTVVPDWWPPVCTSRRGFMNWDDPGQSNEGGISANLTDFSVY